MTHDTLKAPDRIYLIPDGEGSFMWCEDAAPGTDMEPEDAIAYVRAALTQPAAVEDGELRRLMAEATDAPWALDDLDPCVVISVAESQYTPALNTYSNACVASPNNAALIVAAVNALPGLMAERDRMKEALEFYAWQEHWEREPHEIAVAAYDHGKRARAALGGKPNAAIDIMVAASPHALEGEQP